MRRLAFTALLCLVPLAGLAQDLGRLFFTPEQRDALDARRKARMPDKPAAAPVVISPTTRLDGYVQRSAGRSTAFVNGVPVPEGSSEVPRLDPRNDGRVAVPVGEGRARYPLKPGETLDRGSGEVHDLLGEGRVQVRPGR